MISQGDDDGEWRRRCFEAAFRNGARHDGAAAAACRRRPSVHALAEGDEDTTIVAAGTPRTIDARRRRRGDRRRIAGVRGGANARADDDDASLAPGLAPSKPSYNIAARRQDTVRRGDDGQPAVHAAPPRGAQRQ